MTLSSIDSRVDDKNMNVGKQRSYSLGSVSCSTMTVADPNNLLSDFLRTLFRTRRFLYLTEIRLQVLDVLLITILLSGSWIRWTVSVILQEQQQCAIAGVNITVICPRVGVNQWVNRFMKKGNYGRISFVNISFRLQASILSANFLFPAKDVRVRFRPVSDLVSGCIVEMGEGLIGIQHLWSRCDIRLPTKGQVYTVAVRSVLLYESERRPLGA